MGEHDLADEYGKTLLPWSVGISQVYFWTYLVLSILVSNKIRKIEHKSQILKIAHISILLYLAIMFAQSLYVLLERIDNSDSALNRSQPFRTAEKFIELADSFVIFYFVLELVPAIIILDPNVDTPEMTQSYLKIYNIVFYSIMVTAFVNSLCLFIARILDYYDAADA